MSWVFSFDDWKLQYGCMKINELFDGFLFIIYWIEYRLPDYLSAINQSEFDRDFMMENKHVATGSIGFWNCSQATLLTSILCMILFLPLAHKQGHSVMMCETHHNQLANTKKFRRENWSAPTISFSWPGRFLLTSDEIWHFLWHRRFSRLQFCAHPLWRNSWEEPVLWLKRWSKRKLYVLS